MVQDENSSNFQLDIGRKLCSRQKTAIIKCENTVFADPKAVLIAAGFIPVLFFISKKLVTNLLPYTTRQSSSYASFIISNRNKKLCEDLGKTKFIRAGMKTTDRGRKGKKGSEQREHNSRNDTNCRTGKAYDC